MVMPPLAVLSPAEAGWNCSVGASKPASQPASAGTMMAMAPTSRRRVQRVTVRPPRFIPSGTERIVAVMPGLLRRVVQPPPGYGPPGVLGRTGLADRLACAGEFAEPFGRAVPLAGAELAGAGLAGLDRGAADRRPEAAVADGWLWVSGPVAGLNVATDSMAPA